MSEARSLRKTTYRLYPTPKQAIALDALLRSHQQLYNAALEERISAWSKAGKSIGYADQCKSLTVLRRDLPEWADAANCSSQQMTLRRLDKAFAAFFRRVKAGQTPGFPRFKSLGRFPGFSFKTHGDGWRFTPEDGWRHGSLRLSLGINNTEDDVKRVLRELPGVVKTLRDMSPLTVPACTA